MSTNNDALITGLKSLLSDTYVLYVKTQNFHWNITTPHFYAYHKMLEAFYEELAEAADVLAERLRALKTRAPGSLKEFLALATLQEAKDNLSATQMMQALLSDHEKIAEIINELFATAEKCGDEVTLDMLIARKTEHDKTAWMLRSSLEIA